MQGVSGRLLGISDCPFWLISMEPCGNKSDVYELHQNPPSCGHIINPQISTKRMTDLQKWSWRKVGCFHKCWTGSQNLGHHLSLFKVGCHSTGNSPAVYAEQRLQLLQSDSHEPFDIHPTMFLTKVEPALRKPNSRGR